MANLKALTNRFRFQYSKMEVVLFRKDMKNIFNHFSSVCLEFVLRKNCTNMHGFEAGRLKQKPLVEKTKAKFRHRIIIEML